MSEQRTGLLCGVLTTDAIRDVVARTSTHVIRDTKQWRKSESGSQCFLVSDEPNASVFHLGDVDVMIRGYVVPAGRERVAPPQDAAAGIVDRYRRSGELDLGEWDGNFSALVLDAQRAVLLAYRSLANNQFTYFSCGDHGLLLGSNLATIARLGLIRRRIRDDSLPAMFLFRCVPGRETLFEGIERLLPGESLRYQGASLRVQQELTLADLGRGDEEVGNDEAIEQLDDVMSRISEDLAVVDPTAVTLLSGGVDSSAIHAHWRRVARWTGDQPASVSITTGDPLTQGDKEYALSAAGHFGTRHHTVGVDAPYADYLLSAVSNLGEPPNHVQGVFYGDLAREMHRLGLRTGLCGEGADSLLGTPWADLIYRALWIQRMLPGSVSRTSAGRVADAVGKPYGAAAFRLANFVNDFTRLEHPVNQGSVWTHLPTVERCFGGERVHAALAHRRDLLAQYDVSADPLLATHGMTLLGEVIDSASLWTGTFHHAGVDLICPFLDSRMLRLVGGWPRQVRFHYRQPKKVLKDVLLRYMPAPMVSRPKLAFGQPIFPWLAEGGQLRPLVDQIEVDRYPFLSPEVLAEAKATPNWFLFSLLCFDLWRREFIGDR